MKYWGYKLVIPLFENLKQVIRFLFFNYCNLFMWEKLRHGWHSIPACIQKMVKVAKTYGKRCKLHHQAIQRCLGTDGIQRNCLGITHIIRTQRSYQPPASFPCARVTALCNVRVCPNVRAAGTLGLIIDDGMFGAP